MKTPVKKLIDYLNFVGKAKAFLEAEKEFAKNCFMAGCDYAIDLHDSLEYEFTQTEPNFDEFYKQYEDEFN